LLSWPWPAAVPVAPVDSRARSPRLGLWSRPAPAAGGCGVDAALQPGRSVPNGPLGRVSGRGAGQTRLDSAGVCRLGCGVVLGMPLTSAP
jgi:hypothetical protein